MTEYREPIKTHNALLFDHSSSEPTHHKKNPSKFVIKAGKVKNNVYRFLGLDYWFPKNGLF